MANGLKDVMENLERQKDAIERALDALRGVGGMNSSVLPDVAAASASAMKPKRKGGMTPEGRRRLSEALKKRWAARKAAEAATAAKRPAKRVKRASAAASA